MALPPFCQSPSTDLELLHRGSPLLLSWEAQPPEAKLLTLSAHGPPSSVPFPISTTGALGPSLLIPLHQLTALHSPLSELHPSSAWAPELFPQATASQGPFRRERGASLPQQGVCYCCGPEMGETNAGRLTWNIFS